MIPYLKTNLANSIHLWWNSYDHIGNGFHRMNLNQLLQLLYDINLTEPEQIRLVGSFLRPYRIPRYGKKHHEIMQAYLEATLSNKVKASS